MRAGSRGSLLYPATLNQPVVFDGRNMFPPATVEAAGIEYHAIGRLGART